jgi:predicted O-methyltransferase YrrM
MTPEAESVLTRLYAEDAAQRAANLPSARRTRNVECTTGHFLNLLARTMGAAQILEIGSSNGVSTIWLALAAQAQGGSVVGTELLPERAAEANANLATAGLGEIARVVPGDARTTVATLTGPFDFVFIDAEKDDYVDHFQAVIDRVRPGGVVVADNVVSHDLSDYQAMLRARSDVETLTIPLDRGLEYTLKLAVG